jgi:DnaJ-class molecular chaperone
MPLDFDPRVDHYQVLGVDPKASPDEIKKAYRRLAKANHPDTTGGDKAKETRFKEISNAYDVLGDPRKRSQYDQIRSGAFAGAGVGGAGFPGTGAGVWDIGDLFSQVFRGGGGGGRVRVEHFDVGGPGFGPGFDDEAWARAEPRGRRHRDGGSGSGRTAVATSKVRASDGSWLTVDGGDVHSELRISFDRAILGTGAEIATVDGTAVVKVPPGTSSGKKLRLRGKGVPGLDGRVGDHYVTVAIDVPRDLDDDSKKQLVELTQRLSKKPRGG